MDTCILCKSSKKDDVQYGEFLKNKHIGVHTFCLYLSSNLSQNGKDDEGFLGFLDADIRQEVRRISSLKCFYCKKKYANIGCCKKKCRRTFHLICGLENKAQNQFCHDYSSYCHNHVNIVKQRPSSKETCLICYDNLCSPNKKFSSVDMILTPCCRNGWFHKLCLQKFAKTAGYFFKCPLCNDANTFREQLPSRGIFIPNQDAAWELEPNAFADLLERPSECAAKKCKNRKGRKAESISNPFVICITCGSTAMHRNCLPNGGRQFNCNDCKLNLEEGDSGRESVNLNENLDDDEVIDICHVSDFEDIDIVNIFRGNTNKSVEEQNNRDSGSYHNDVYEIESSECEGNIGHLKKSCRNKRRRIESSEENGRNSDTESNIMQTRWLKSNSNIDVQVAHIKNLEQTYNNQNSELRCKTDSESSEISEQELRKPRCSTHTRALKTDFVCSATKTKNFEEESIRRCKKRRATTMVSTFSDKDDEENVMTSMEEKIVPFSRECNSVIILTDSEDDQDVSYSTENKSLESKINDSIALEESDEDDDPLENFEKLMKKQTNISCIALRTRRSQKFHKAHDFNSGKTNSNMVSVKEKINIRADTNVANINRKSVENSKKSTFASLKDEVCSKKKANLDISCIAKRTRRKSMYCRSNNINEMEKLTQQKENSTTVNCNEKRTRRKTICGQTNYSQEPIFEMSQIYNKMHESDDDNKELEWVTKEEDVDEEAEYEPHINAHLNYEKKGGKSNISCIANRTRRRKSSNAFGTNLQSIEEEYDDSSFTSTNSPIQTPTFSNVNFRRRCNQRITSNSSAELNTPQPKHFKTSNCHQNVKTSSLLLENMPQYNYNAFLEPKYSTKTSSSNTINKYHFHDLYHSHINNRKRV